MAANFIFSKTDLEGAFIIEPRVFEDERGFFSEIYNEREFDINGIADTFIQDNHSFSRGNILRGIHFQRHPHGMSKLVRCVRGEIFDVIVDIRKDSPTFGKWRGFNLSGANKKLIYIPAGFAHGYCVLSSEADVHYKTNDFYFPELDSGIIWNDPDLNIIWPVENPVLSKKDSQLGFFKELNLF